MSHKWHGSQANNKHSVMIVDAGQTAPGYIKDKKDRESGQFEAISITVRGKERKMRRVYFTKDEGRITKNLTTFQLQLRKADPSAVAEIKRRKLTHEVSSGTSLVAASNMTVESSPIEESTRLPPKKQFLQRM